VTISTHSLPPIGTLLGDAVRSGASDVHLKVGVPPIVRVDGDLRPSAFRPLSEEDAEDYLADLLPSHLRNVFAETNEADFAYGSDGVGRFRVNAYRQRGRVSVAIRVITPPTQDFEALGLPAVLDRLVEEPRGLILVTGPTGSGKSTTLAAMVDAINRQRRVNIITIEDPIEVIHADQAAIVSQREVGIDTDSFAEAMRRVLRQDPDVIMVGEMRDVATIDAALKAAETGHLVLSSLHTLDATETINRILDFFPGHQQSQVRLLMAATLRGIVSQRLVVRADGNGRVPAVEVLVNTERAAERIANPATTHEIPDIIGEGEYYGMQTFDDSILSLLSDGVITMGEALRNATRPGDLKIRARQMGLIVA
jgi:twitching motility protein PilT